MAKPRASSKPRQCHACGKDLTPAYFKQNAVVCNLCLLENQGVIPSVLPFAPKPPEPPPPDTSLDGISLPNSIETLELAERILAQRSMLAFVQRFKADYMAGWVHVDICRRLERFMKDVEARKSPRLLLCMPPRHGKQLADDTPMLTSNRGWTTHGDLRVGDSVFSPSGSPTEVVAVSAPADQDCEIEFSNGAVVRCHENHEWRVYDRSARGNKWKTVSTAYLESRCLNNDGRFTIQMPVHAALEYPEADLPVNPYTFGAWLGDGTSTKSAISCASWDEDVFLAVQADGYARTSTYVHKDTGVLTAYFHGKLYRALKPFFGEKKIPDVYKRASVRQRLDLIAGFVDTDGHVEHGTGRVRIATCSQYLRDDLVEVLTGLGFRPYVYEQEPTLSTSGIQGTKPVFYVGFQPTMFIPTVLLRKKIRCMAKQRRMGVVAVRRVEPCVGRCIEVAAPDGLYLAGKSLVVTHNSTLTSNFFPPWVLGHHPNWEIIAASHTQSLALKFSGFIRDLLRDPSYQAVFPDTVLNPDSQSKEAWDTMARGGYLAAGIGTGITGRGAHILIIDDPVKDMEAADSVTIRDNTWEWYGSTAYTRLAPGGGVLGILTLWNEDDWGGRVIEVSESGEGDKFEIVRYPAINEGYAEVLHPDERTIIQVPVTYSVGKGGAKTRNEIVIPPGHTLIREPDSALHPARYDYEALMKIKKNYYARGNQRVWHALYQQAPSPEEGVFFTKGMFRFYSTAPSRRHRTIYQAWDFAITEKQTSDYTVGVTILQDENDSLYVLDVTRFREDDSHEIIERVLDYARDWDADMLGFEDGQIWKAMFPQFEKRCRERVMYPTYETLTPLTDKKVRAFPLRGRMQLGKIYFNDQADWWEPLRKEMLSFQGGGKHDDQVDALAWAVRLTLSHAAPVIPLRNDKIKSWKDNLNQYMEGGDATHMAA